MNKKLHTYIMALFVCMCCSLAAHAQTDSSSIDIEDSTAVDTTTAGGNGNYGSHNSLDKFSKIEPGDNAVVTERKLPSSRQQDLKKNKDYWYADKPVNVEQPPPQEEYHPHKSIWDFINSSVMYAIFWAVVIGAFLLILFLYLRTFTSSAKKIRRATGIETVMEEENIFSINFDEAINKALAENNYRLATRLLFLRLLRNMSEKKVIQYGQDKTNMDYLFELGNTKYMKEFMQATRTYEYVWYGGFVPQQQQFAGIKNIIDGLNQKIN